MFQFHPTCHPCLSVYNLVCACPLAPWFNDPSLRKDTDTAKIPGSNYHISVSPIKPAAAEQGSCWLTSLPAWSFLTTPLLTAPAVIDPCYIDYVLLIYKVIINKVRCYFIYDFMFQWFSLLCFKALQKLVCNSGHLSSTTLAWGELFHNERCQKACEIFTLREIRVRVNIYTPPRVLNISLPSVGYAGMRDERKCWVYCFSRSSLVLHVVLETIYLGI